MPLFKIKLELTIRGKGKVRNFFKKYMKYGFLLKTTPFLLFFILCQYSKFNVVQIFIIIFLYTLFADFLTNEFERLRLSSLLIFIDKNKGKLGSIHIFLGIIFNYFLYYYLYSLGVIIAPEKIYIIFSLITLVLFGFYFFISYLIFFIFEKYGDKIIKIILFIYFIIGLIFFGNFSSYGKENKELESLIDNVIVGQIINNPFYFYIYIESMAEGVSINNNKKCPVYKVDYHDDNYFFIYNGTIKYYDMLKISDIKKFKIINQSEARDVCERFNKLLYINNKNI